MKQKNLNRRFEYIPKIRSFEFIFTHNGEIIDNPPNRNDIDLLIMDKIYQVRVNPNEKTLFALEDLIMNKNLAKEIAICEKYQDFQRLLPKLFDKYFFDFYKDLLYSLFEPLFPTISF